MKRFVLIVRGLVGPVELPVQLGIHASHTPHDACKLLYFYGTEGENSALCVNRRERLTSLKLTSSFRLFAQPILGDIAVVAFVIFG